IDNRPLEKLMPGSSGPPDRTPLPVIRLDATRGSAKPGSDWATATVKLTIGRELQHLQISVPPGPARLRELLPVFEGLANLVVDVEERQFVARGETVSCKKGCGACCRQLVPLSAAEAHRIAELVAALPEPRQSRIRQRFAEAHQRLVDVGLLAQL